jgi:hypothetical protein
MKQLFTNAEYDNAKSTDKLPCECYQCGDSFFRIKKELTRIIKSGNNGGKFCSNNCTNNNNKKFIVVNCSNCGLEITKIPSQIRTQKNFYCSNSCNASYCNKNKTHGTKRSKLEIWLEEGLYLLYPELSIDFNKKLAIGSELDIYIPSLNIAFELNGIFHYEPIFGVTKLEQIQSNDISKSKACYDNKIDLCIIDTSAQKYVKPSTSQKYLDIIINIINERLLVS